MSTAPEATITHLYPTPSRRTHAEVFIAEASRVMAIPGATESALDFHFHTFASAMAVEITGDHNLLVEKPSLEINFARAVIAASDNRVTWIQTVSYTHLTLPTIYSV